MSLRVTLKLKYQLWRFTSNNYDSKILALTSNHFRKVQLETFPNNPDSFQLKLYLESWEKMQDSLMI